MGAKQCADGDEHVKVDESADVGKDDADCKEGAPDANFAMDPKAHGSKDEADKGEGSDHNLLDMALMRRYS
ncbi:MAG: hypothetical protein SP1CHLAM54_13320 [Chlamydiia bacterium]|nr:hypothetical protein [Chlamydiia bacterium]MCH9616228.1 hypothetical protein [Chlamydiia bacterium]MCH9629786.1 hypothetical protein [Chlamydiia bacterium]